MRDRSQKKLSIRTSKNTGIWLALAAALGIHVIVLLLPVARQLPLSEPTRELIELQIATIEQQVPDTQTEVEQPDKLPEIETVARPPIEAETTIYPVEDQPVPSTEEPSHILTPNPQLVDSTKDLESVDQTNKRPLTSSILSRQFITEKTITEELFPDTLVNDNPGFQAEYHMPVRQSMIAILDQPMPELPWSYEPGLVYFAYDPGIKGDLQRFWDVITPEIAFRTKYGTEVRCIWILIVGGCAWK